MVRTRSGFWRENSQKCGFPPLMTRSPEELKSQVCPHWTSSDLSVTIDIPTPLALTYEENGLSSLHKNHFSNITQRQFQPDSFDSKSTSPCGENENWKQESPSMSLLMGPVQWRTVVTAPGKMGQVSRDSDPLVNFVTATAHSIVETTPLSRLQEYAVQYREVPHNSTFCHHRNEPNIYWATNHK